MCPTHHVSLDDLDQLLKYVEERAKIHVNCKLTKTVPRPSDKTTEVCMLQSYCETGRYLTMFDVKHSGVGSSGHVRKKLERALFGEIYDGHNGLRPRYGSMNLMAHTKGDFKASRYGPSYMILKDHVRKFCTVTSCDTSRPEAQLGTLEHCAHVLCHTIELCDVSKETKERIKQETSDEKLVKGKLQSAKAAQQTKFLEQLHKLIKLDCTAECPPTVDVDLTR